MLFDFLSKIKANSFVDICQQFFHISRGIWPQDQSIQTRKLMLLSHMQFPKIGGSKLATAMLGGEFIALIQTETDA